MSMKLLYPLRSLTPDGAVSGSNSVTVLVCRVVSAAEELSFLATLKELLQEYDRFPGTLGRMVFRRECDGNLEFSILQRIAGETDHEAWLNSPGFVRWRNEVALTTPMPDHVQRYSGMEALFVTTPAPVAPPRWKMALLLLIAVYPISLSFSHWLAPALASVSLFTGTFITSVIMVLSITYAIVPLLTKLFQRWLGLSGQDLIT